MLALLVVAALGAAVPVEPVNAVVGDAGFAAAVGRAPTAADDDTLRIALHLAYVEAVLRAAPVTHLAPEHRDARARHLDRLHAYRIAGRFPAGSPGPRLPTFIDGEGRLCAVGDLVAHDVGVEVARALDRRLHHVLILDADDPTLTAWAAGAGFTLRELAMIQPTYGPHDRGLQLMPVEPWFHDLELSIASRWLVRNLEINRRFRAERDATSAGIVAAEVERREGLGVRATPRAVRTAWERAARRLERVAAADRADAAARVGAGFAEWYANEQRRFPVTDPDLIRAERIQRTGSAAPPLPRRAVVHDVRPQPRSQLLGAGGP